MRRRSVVGLALAALAAVPLAATSTHSQAASQVGQAATTSAFSLQGYVAGGVKSADFSQPLTFVFTERNTGSRGATEDLILTRLVGNHVTATSCVMPGGNLINTDTKQGASSGKQSAATAAAAYVSFCEPGFVTPGQSASIVVNTQVDNSADHISARVCLSNESNGTLGACLTLFVQNS